MKDLITAALLGSLATASFAEAPKYPAKVGDQTLVVSSYQHETSSEESSGSASGRSALIERVIAMTDKGIELEYTEPASPYVTKKGGKPPIKNWQFPARVFKPFAGPAQLLNLDQIDKRLTLYLKQTETPREACGRWSFTWIAIKTECDPRSVLDIINGYDLGFCTYRAGQVFTFPYTLTSETRLEQDGDELSANFTLDPAVLRRKAAQSTMAVAEIYRQNKTLEQALAEDKDTQFSGKLKVSLTVDTHGCATKQVATYSLETIQKGGVVEKQVNMETIERQAYVPVAKKPQLKPRHSPSNP
jgi:hypothetical protein